MEGKMNLWQRCEALGPMEDQGVSLYRTDSGDYRIFIDRATVFHVHQDGTIGDYCRAWLAEAILQRFEAITKQGGIVLTTANVVKEVERVYNEIPKQQTPTMPAQELLVALVEYLRTMDQEKQAVLGIKIIGKTLAAIEANAMHVGEIAVFDLANMVGIGGNQQALMFRMRVESGKVTEFTSDMEWNSILNRIGIDVPELPTPETLPDPTYIVEAPKPTEPTQEQLKAIWDHVMHLTGEQAESYGFQYAVIGNAAQANFELHIKSLGSRFGEWQIKIMHGHIGRYWWENPFDLVTTARLINMAITIPTEQYVTESPLQFVSIPVQDWQEVLEAFMSLGKVLNSHTA